MGDIEEIRRDRDEALSPGLDPSDPIDAAAIEEARGEPWKIDGPSTASWALRRLGRAQREREDVMAAYNEERKVLDAWRDRALAGPERSMAYFEMQCNLWFRGLREGEGGDKSIKSKRLPGGVVKVTRSQTVEVVDVDAFLAWAKENDLPFVKTEETPKRGDLKKVLVKDGDGVLQPLLVGEDGKKPLDGVRIPGIKIEVNDNYSAVPDMGAPEESSDEGLA